MAFRQMAVERMKKLPASLRSPRNWGTSDGAISLAGGSLKAGLDGTGLTPNLRQVGLLHSAAKELIPSLDFRFTVATKSSRLSFHRGNKSSRKRFM